MKEIGESHQGRSKYRISKQSGITCEWFLRWSRIKFERRFKSCVCFSKKSTWMWMLRSNQRSQSIRCDSNSLAKRILYFSSFFWCFQNFKINYSRSKLTKFSFCQNWSFYTAIFFNVTSFLFSSKYFLTQQLLPLYDFTCSFSEMSDESGRSQRYSQLRLCQLAKHFLQDIIDLMTRGK